MALGMATFQTPLLRPRYNGLRLYLRLGVVAGVSGDTEVEHTEIAMIACARPGGRAGEPEAWKGCYSRAWDYWTVESMAHPAKMSPGLALVIMPLRRSGVARAEGAM